MIKKNFPGLKEKLTIALLWKTKTLEAADDHIVSLAINSA